MRFKRPDVLPNVNLTGCIVLPVSLFVALMIATAGFAVWPSVAAPGAAIVCGGGEVVHDSQEYRRPGEYTLTRQIHCQTGAGKDVAREEITFSAMAVSFLIYAAALFLLLQFVVRPLVVRRVRRRMEGLGFGTAGAASPSGLGDLFDRVQDAARRGEVRVRDAADPEPDGGDAGARLAQLRALRDRGLITAEEYQAKKAEILAGL